MWITWMDKVRDEDIRKKTGSRKLEDLIKERRLRWFGHVLRMDNTRTARQATQWELMRGYKRKPGRPRKNWVDGIKRSIPQEHGLDLGRSQGTGDRQSRMASTCSPMQPSGCGKH